MCYSLIKEKPLQEIYASIKKALYQAKLSLDDSNGWKETIEIHLPDPDYQYAFGSIQYCKECKSHASFLELRFKRLHLNYVGMLSQLDELQDKPYRNDAKSKNPEAIRFRFYTLNNEALDFISDIGNVLTKGLNK